MMYLLSEKNVFRKRITALIICMAMFVFTAVTAYGFEIGYNTYSDGTLVGTFENEDDAETLGAYIYEMDGIDVSDKLTTVMGIVNNGKFTTLKEAADNVRSADSRYVKCYNVCIDKKALFSVFDKEILTRAEDELIKRYSSEGEGAYLSPKPEIMEGYAVKGSLVEYAEALELLSEKVNVESVIKKTEYVCVPYNEIIVTDDAMYQNERIVLTEGISEEKYVEYTTVKINGQVTGTYVTGETILRQGVDSVVKVGTIDPCIAKGCFINPTEGVLTSPFGARWGKQHEGIDIGADGGTDILAADGGRVVYAGWMSGYGNFIKIDHENGYVTAYAHCSKLLVGVGDRVYQGQHIAEMGSTGRSTGNHLHFEILNNGQPENPMNYIKR